MGASLVIRPTATWQWLRGTSYFCDKIFLYAGTQISSRGLNGVRSLFDSSYVDISLFLYQSIIRSHDCNIFLTTYMSLLNHAAVYWWPLFEQWILFWQWVVMWLGADVPPAVRRDTTGMTIEGQFYSRCKTRLTFWGNYLFPYPERSWNVLQEFLRNPEELIRVQ